MTIQNPYSPGSKITDPAMFFGRQAELKEVRHRMQQGASTSIIGLRRIGKSSLLYHLAHENLPDKVCPVYLDLQASDYREPLNLLDAAWQQLAQFATEIEAGLPIASMNDFSSRVQTMKQQGYQAVLCLDEFEELITTPQLDDDFFEAWRSLGDNRYLAFVTTSKIGLEQLLKTANRSSPFYNIFIPKTLKGLDPSPARDLLCDPFSRANLELPTPEQLEALFQLAGHHPFYLQIAGYHLFEASRTGQPVNLTQIKRAFTDQAEPHLQMLWDDLTEEQQAGLQKVVEPSMAVPHWQDRLYDLARAGLVIQGRVFSAVWADKIIKKSLPPPAPPPPKKPTLIDSLRETLKNLPWKQRLLLSLSAGLIILGLIWGVLWWQYARPSHTVTMQCDDGTTAVALTMTYPHYLAEGDQGEGRLYLKNLTDHPLTTTLIVDLHDGFVAIVDGQDNTVTLADIQAGQRPHREIIWQRNPPHAQTGSQFTPTVRLQVAEQPLPCPTPLEPMVAGPLPYLNSSWSWLVGAVSSLGGLTGLLGWLLAEMRTWWKET